MTRWPRTCLHVGSMWLRSTTSPSEVYPREVTVRLQPDARGSYREAARRLNDSGAEVVYLQHEFGIFGGAGGSYVLDLVAALDAPLVTTLHTVRASPTDSQREVMDVLLAASSQVVVMSQTSVDCLSVTTAPWEAS